MPVEYVVDIIESNKLHTKLIFMSSDYVFDGSKGNYKDDDIPNPNTNYGITKFLAEQLLLQSKISHKIVRSSAVVGKGGTFYNWIIEQFNNCQVELFSNVYFTPTPASFLCEVLYRLIIDFDSIDKNILHIVGEKKMSRYEFGVMVYEFYKNKLNMKKNVKLVPKELQLEHTFFRRDLSMIQSTFVRRYQNRKFEDYIKEEISNV
jgi:dTDP-4-dehydrorhamnose reductase